MIGSTEKLSYGLRTPCDGPETPTEWKYDSGDPPTNQLTDRPADLLPRVGWRDASASKSSKSIRHLSDSPLSMLGRWCELIKSCLIVGQHFLRKARQTLISVSNIGICQIMVCQSSKRVFLGGGLHVSPESIYLYEKCCSNGNPP